jgi:hypothetical protein
MTRERPPVDAGLQRLLERGRTIRPVPALVRARALARARATIAAAKAAPADATRSPPPRRYHLRFAFAASLALAAGAAGAAIGLVSQAFHPPELAPAASPRAAAPVRGPAIDLSAKGGPMPEPPATVAVASLAASAKRPRPARPLTPRESYAAELELLQRAQAAYVGRSFLNALAILAEHRRRFPSGRLAEEREALRVRSLAASGRTEESRRAVETFAGQFPHSVLLPRLQQAATGQE